MYTYVRSKRYGLIQQYLFIGSQEFKVMFMYNRMFMFLINIKPNNTK